MMQWFSDPKPRLYSEQNTDSVSEVDPVLLESSLSYFVCYDASCVSSWWKVWTGSDQLSSWKPFFVMSCSVCLEESMCCSQTRVDLTDLTAPMIPSNMSRLSSDTNGPHTDNKPDSLWKIRGGPLTLQITLSTEDDQRFKLWPALFWTCFRVCRSSLHVVSTRVYFRNFLCPVTSLTSWSASGRFSSCFCLASSAFPALLCC